MWNGVNFRHTPTKQNIVVPIMAIIKTYDPQAIPVPRAANMKMMSRGSRKVVLKLMIVKAPRMPNPEATLSPILCRIMVAIIELRIRDWI